MNLAEKREMVKEVAGVKDKEVESEEWKDLVERVEILARQVVLSRWPERVSEEELRGIGLGVCLERKRTEGRPLGRCPVVRVKYLGEEEEGIFELWVEEGVELPEGRFGS